MLPSEPAFFRKELHFFDDDLRFTRGLHFYSAHFPRCARGVAATARSPMLWSHPPARGVEILLEDASSGEAVGWDAELNIPTTAHNTMLLLPASERTSRGARDGQRDGGRASDRTYWLVDATSSQLLYLREWVLRAAPLSYDDSRRQFELRPAGSDAFFLVDRNTQRMLYWADNVIRVRPFDEHEPRRAWKLRRMSDTDCPHWASISHRGGNASAREWAVSAAAVARGECAAACEGSRLVRSLEELLAARRRLTRKLRSAVCDVACADELERLGGSGTPSLPGCLCSLTPARPDCGCRSAAGAGQHYSLDATPMQNVAKCLNQRLHIASTTAFPAVPRFQRRRHAPQSAVASPSPFSSAAEAAACCSRAHETTHL